MDSKKPLYKSIIFWIMVLFLLYSALGFFAVPYLAKEKSKEFVLEQLNSTVKIGNISFNPFFISTKITDLTFTDKDNTTWFSADSLYVNVNLWDTLWNNASLAKLEVTNPHYNIVTHKINHVANLKYPNITTSKTSNDTKVLLLDIEEINIHQGSIDYNDKTGDKHLSLNLQEIVFKQQKFTTKDNETEFDLSFLTNNNEEAKFQGKFNFAKLSLDLNWSLKNWSTATILHFISDIDNQLLGFKNKSGNLDAHGRVLHSGSSNTLPELFIDKLSISDFRTVENAEVQPNVFIPSLILSKAKIDLNNETIDIEDVMLANAEIAVNITDEYTITAKNLVAPATEASSNNNWLYTIQQIKVNNAQLLVQRQVNETSETSDNSIVFNNISISNFSNTEQQETDIKLTLIADETGSIEFNGKFLLDPVEVTADITMQDTDISKWNSWLPNDINLTAESGKLSLQQTIILNDKNFSSNGWVKVNDLKLLEDNNQQFLTIKQLDLLQSSIDSSKKSVILNTIKINQAAGTLSISPDKQLNLNNLINSEKVTTNSTEKDWTIEIKEIELLDSKTSFKDKSIKPHYHTELSNINGTIKGLSNENLSKAQVDVKAVLDTYGKINISGQINPLSDHAYTDLSVTVQNLSLQNFNSYSSQFLGFPITRGKADFELKYKLNQSLLQGINNLTFKQLQFGAKNQSKDAINLPLKLAVTLLTDNKGLMKINLPVSGNLDDPEFSYGGIVFKAFFKLITGIVASPFKLLGKLIPGGADLDLSGIQFKPGTIELNKDEATKLGAMQKIIKQRPDIILELTGIVNTIEDKKTLQHSSLLQQLKLDTQPDFDHPESLKILEEYYKTNLPQEQWQQLVTNASKDDVLNTQLLAENAWSELLVTQDITEQLNQLAAQRSKIIQQQLIDNYLIPVDNIFLKPSEHSEELYPQVKFGVGS